jgi:hypothetical protein
MLGSEVNCVWGDQGAVILFIEWQPLLSFRAFSHDSVLCTFNNIQHQQQLGLSEARSLAAPWEDRPYSTPWQAVRPSHHSTNHRPFTPLLLLAWQGVVLGQCSTLSPSVVVVVTVDRGRILGRNWDKSLKSFSSWNSQSPLREVWELSRLWTETSTKLYVHEFGFWFISCTRQYSIIKEWCLKIVSTNTTCPLSLLYSFYPPNPLTPCFAAI